MNNEFDCTVADIEVGVKFYFARYDDKPWVLKKIEEIGNTGGSWCWCEDVLTGKTYRVMWNQQIIILLP